MKASQIFQRGLLSIGLYIIFSLLLGNITLFSYVGLFVVTILAKYISLSTFITILIIYSSNILTWFIIGGIMGIIIKDGKSFIVVMIINFIIISIISLELSQTCCTKLSDIKWN
jgi:hypothetical protein